MTPDSVSIVIPCFNEERRLPATIEAIHGFFHRRGTQFELIIVDDGSVDDTSKLVNDVTQTLTGITLIRHEKNTGKGFAVKAGVLRSLGSAVLICDADLSTPIDEIDRLLPLLDEGCDIVIGSRRMRDSNIVMKQPWYRQVMGKIYNMLVNSVLALGFRDTQCGFKLFKGDVARSLFAKSRINGFSFDAEILFMAKRQGLKVREMPVSWSDSRGSKISVLTDPLKMMGEVFKVRINWLIGVYD